MITAKSAAELATPRSTDDVVNASLFYIEQYVRTAAQQGERQIRYILGDEMRERDDAVAALTKTLQEHEFAVTREKDDLIVSWGAAAA